MSNFLKISIFLTVLLLAGTTADARRESSRGGFGYRENSGFVLKRLALKPGHVVVDIGAGDGWWAERMAEKVGEKGLIHAGEVDQKKVDKMKEKFARTSRVKPYLCPTDGTGLDEDSCDLAFISKTYHHFDKDGHVDYLRHLKRVVKPNGRVCVVERHPALADGGGKEHAWCPGLLAQQADQAGWILLRCEMIKGSDHFMAIFVQTDSLKNKISRNKARNKKD
ncbi:MAG: class I SAM-dependent methyltransferase [Planctomycetota bacterium]